MAKRGRPSDYTKAKAKKICDRLVGGESLRTICSDKDMPSKPAVLRWLQANEDFRTQYAQARELQAEHMAEEILEISDYAERDWTVLKDADGNVTGVKVDGENVQRSKLKVDTRKWLMAKMMPKKYGDRITQEQTGPDGGPVIFQMGVPKRED